MSSVIAAAAAAWVSGAVWCMALSRPWMAVPGARVDAIGRPDGDAGATPFILSAVAMLIVAGFMRQTHVSPGDRQPGQEGGEWPPDRAVVYLALDMIRNAHPGRSFLPSLTDSGCATVGCGIIGGG